MTDHHTRAGIDCPRCGQRYVDIDLHDYVDAGHTPEQFADMCARLVSAHTDTCDPRTAKPDPADARRRTWWWAGKLVVPALLTVTAASRLLVGDPVGAVALACAVAVLLMQPWTERLAYRAGYWRGRTTATGPVTAERLLHPADREWIRP